MIVITYTSPGVAFNILWLPELESVSCSVNPPFVYLGASRGLVLSEDVTCIARASPVEYQSP